MTPLYFIIFFLLLLAAPVPLRLRLCLSYPLRPRPKIFNNISQADLRFGLRLAKFLRERLWLTKLHCRLQMQGRPDVCALAAGSLSAALHSLAAAEGCRNTDFQLQLAAEKTAAEICLHIYLPLWAIIAAGARLAAYLGRRRFKLNRKTAIYSKKTI